MQKTVLEVTERIVRRSRANRERYLRNMEQALTVGPFRHRLPASNLAHVMAVTRGEDRERMLARGAPHIAIVTAYNDLVSAHHTFENYPAILKRAVAAAGGVAQVAGGVPGMCDGVIQGEPGMDVSLISRDVIAMATVIELAHNAFDGALLLGICDKILPGMLLGALQYGHLPPPHQLLRHFPQQPLHRPVPQPPRQLLHQPIPQPLQQLLHRRHRHPQIHSSPHIPATAAWEVLISRMKISCALMAIPGAFTSTARMLV